MCILVPQLYDILVVERRSIHRPAIMSVLTFSANDVFLDKICLIISSRDPTFSSLRILSALSRIKLLDFHRIQIHRLYGGIFVSI
ncbi:hypothetical protein Plhal304r1_c039g0116341 [Plasmopara halstedii]